MYVKRIENRKTVKISIIITKRAIRFYPYDRQDVYKRQEQGVFECVGIANIDLRIKVKRKMTAKKKTIYKKRQDRKFLVGRPVSYTHLDVYKRQAKYIAFFAPPVYKTIILT